jgi:hypothetical protein
MAIPLGSLDHGTKARAIMLGARIRATALILSIAVGASLGGTSAAQASNPPAGVYPSMDCYAPVDQDTDLVRLEVMNALPLPMGTAGTSLTNSNFYDFMAPKLIEDPTPDFFSSGSYFPPTDFQPGITHFQITIDTNQSTTWLLGDTALTITPSTFTAEDLCPAGPQGATGPQGPQGPPGEPGLSGVVHVQSPGQQTLAGRARRMLHIDCPAGKSSLAGGWNLVGPRSAKPPAELGSFPDGAGGWSVRLGNRSPKPVSVMLYASCADG